MLDPERLIAYCGIYRGTCARYLGNTAFRDAAALLLELADAHGFIYWMDEHVPFGYQNFRKGLKFFASKISLVLLSGWL